MALISQSDVAKMQNGDWRKTALRDLAERLSPPSDFPCTFSQNAFRRTLLQFAFIGAPGEAGFRIGAGALTQYVKECRQWDGRVNSAKPLLMVFSEQAAQCETLEGYQDLGWRALQYWHDIDPEPWPEDVSQRPQDPFWSFCFAGMQLFVNMSAPAHRKRRSRNLGRYFMLVINPRERFDLVAGDTPEGQKVRSRIRQRSTDYDGMPHSSLLGSFQKGELEWVQYALPDDNTAEVGQCPFRFRG